MKYHKISSLYKRNTKGKMLFGDYSEPEFEYLAGNQWLFTEKVDGTNIRVMFQDKQLTFGGRTDNAQLPAKLVGRLQEIFFPQIDRLFIKFPDGAILYGEGYGAGIQKGGKNYKEIQDFVLFDVKIGDYWLSRLDVEDVAMYCNIDIVPIVGEGTLFDMEEIVDDGVVSSWGDFYAEGIVARPFVELYNRKGERIITKLKQRDFE